MKPRARVYSRVFTSTRGYSRARKHAQSKVYERYVVFIDVTASTSQRGRVVFIKHTIIFSSIIHYAYCRNNCHPHEPVSLFFFAATFSLEKQISFFKLRYTGAALLGNIFSLFTQKHIIKNVTFLTMNGEIILRSYFTLRFRLQLK